MPDRSSPGAGDRRGVRRRTGRRRGRRRRRDRGVAGLGADGHRLRRPGRSRPVWSTCTRICASPGCEHKETDRDRDARGRGRRVHGRLRRWRTPIRWRTTPRSMHEVRDLARGRRRLRRLPGRGDHARAWAGSSWPSSARWSRPGVRMFSDDGRCVPTARLLRNALTYVRRRSTTSCSPSTARTRRSPRAGRCTRAASYRRSGSPGSPREAEEVVVARDLAIARADRRSAAPVPPVDRAVRSSCVRRAEGRGRPRDRRGHAAPPRVHATRTSSPTTRT